MDNDSKLLHLSILTPSNSFYDSMVNNIIVAGEKSPFQVLFNHAPIISTIMPGIIRVVDNKGDTIYFFSDKGVIEVLNNHVTIAVNYIENIANMDIANLMANITKLRHIVKTSPDEFERHNATAKLQLLDLQLKLISTLR